MDMIPVREREVIEAVRARGHGKVELFDARTCRKKDEVPFENFVAIPQQRITREFAKLAFAQYWPSTRGNSYSGQYFSSVSPTATGVWDAYEHNVNMMSILAATASTKTEDPATEVWCPTAAVIAAAAPVGSGVSITALLAGTANTTEQRLSYGRVKYVFDWPTSAGNGTFQSLCWIPTQTLATTTTSYLARFWKYGTFMGTADSPSAPLATSGKITHASDIQSAGFAFDPSDATIVWKQSAVGTPVAADYQPATGQATIRAYVRATGAFASGTPNIVPQSNAAGSPYSASNYYERLFGVDASYVYTMDVYTNTAWKIRRYNKSTGALVSTSTQLTGVSQIVAVSLDSVNGKIYISGPEGVSEWPASTGGGAATRVFNVHPVTGAAFGGSNCNAVVYDGVMHVASNFLATVPGSGTTLGLLTSIETYAGSDYNTQWQFVPPAVSGDTAATAVDPILVPLHYSLGTDIKLPGVRYMGLGARTKLASPVIKSSSQTMKITYQFD